ANNVLNTITFRASGALRQLNYGNGRRLTMGYNDNRNQPTSMVVDRTNNSADKVVDYAYQYYDANGKNNNRIRQITDNIDTAYSTTYSYDNYNRLTNATANAFSRNYQHDPFGNITNFSGLTLNYQTNSSGAPTTNRIDTDSQNFSYTYDAAGNMTVGAGQSYSYDGANRLKTASGGTSSYGYDGDGKRVKKTENGATTYYVYSSKLGQSVMEVNSSSVQRAYVYSGSKLVAMQATDGQFYWLHTNHLGNSRAMTDGSGNLTYKGQFDPYGATLTEWSGSGNTNLNSKKFTGYERDSATGLDYANARMYNSARGRFMTPDPIGLKAADLRRPHTLNSYSYVQNDPVNLIDPGGLESYLWTCETIGWLWDGRNERWFMIEQCSLRVLSSRDPSGKSGGGGDSRGGGERRQNRAKAQFDLNKLKTCAKDIYGVEVEEFQGPGEDGRGDGIFKAKGNDIIAGKQNTSITILTDRTSYTGAELATVNRQDDWIYGLTFSNGYNWAGHGTQSPYKNYVASDIPFHPDMAANAYIVSLATQVHEIAHSLAEITGLSNPAVGEEGFLFEKCVFGGKVNDDGTIEP
ncbi:MAG: RHS repeat-associated core domain-containing protein, partial [Acidobacteriota bacterium]|nr:RHS repeat-associated core domain-containing protein [Acidobacteriota bacterium]